MSDWGQGAKNNNIGWGQGAVNNDISWGSVHANSWAGDTDIVGSSSIYDATYQAILDYATTQGYTLPSDEQKLLQNQLLIDLKSAGVWNKLDTFANFATDGSTQFALIDWKRLVQYDASTNPTFTTNEGFMGNGTSSYINTNFNPATQGFNYTLNNASRFMYLFTGTSGQRLDGNSIFSDFIRLGNLMTSNINAGSVNTLNSAFNYTATKGMKSIHRTSSTDVTLYNASVGENRTQVSTTMPSANQWILRQGGNYSNAKVSMYAMGSSLISENTDFVNAFDTYLNSL